MTSALHELAEAFRDPAGTLRRRRGAGETVVACVGADIPAEVLAAAGLGAVWVSGDPAVARGEADGYLGDSTDERSRSQLAQLLAGEYEGVAALIVCHDSEGSRRLFSVVAELRRMGLAPWLPDPHLFDLLHLPYRTSQGYNERKVAALLELAAACSARPVDPEELRAAIAAADERRGLIAELGRLRAAPSPPLTGVQALAAIGAGRALPVGEHVRLLQGLLEEASALPAHDGVRVFVTGSDHDHHGLYELIESCGAVVVGEDQAWGMPEGEARVAASGDPIADLAAHYQFRVTSSAKRTIAERAAWTAARARACGAQIVIGFGRRGDEAPAWDVPAQREALRTDGIPMTFIADVPYAAEIGSECSEAVRNAVSSQVAGGVAR